MGEVPLDSGGAALFNSGRGRGLSRTLNVNNSSMEGATDTGEAPLDSGGRALPVGTKWAWSTAVK